MSKRIKWVDIAKGIAIIAMICGHECSGFLREIIFSFHMPIFFILSGYTSHERSSLKDIWDTVRKLFKRIIIPVVLTVSVVNIEWFLLDKESFLKCIYYIYNGIW